MSPVLYDHRGNAVKPVMSYNAAKFTRETNNLPSICKRPENEVTASDLSVLRARCRHIAQNYPQATGYVEQFTRRVATQLRIQARMVNADNEPLEEENTRVERLLKNAWKANRMQPWTGFTSDGLSFGQAMRMAMRTRFVDGEVFLVKGINNDTRRTIKREWQVIDADQVADVTYSQSAYKNVRKGNKVVQGVEVNSAGRPVAYHFYTDGKSRGYGGVGREITRIPVERVHHWFRPERPGQVRGVSEIARVVLAFADVEEFSKAKIQAEWIANAFAVLLHSENMEGTITQFTDDSQTTSDGTTYFGDVQPGTIQALPAGLEATFANPNRPGGNIEEFTRVYQRAIACACGISYEEFTRDFSNTNYSSARAALQDSLFTYGDWCEDFDDNFIAPIYEDAVNFLVFINQRMDKPAAQDIYAHEVQHKKPGWVDPAKEVKADLEAVNGNLDTLTNRCAAHGLDFREVAMQRAKEKALLRELGLDEAEVMGAVAQAQPAQNDNTQANDEGAKVYALSAN